VAMRRGSLLYLTQADPHDVTLNRPALSGKRLRSYLMFYGMFFDKLMTGDSQFINNVSLRSLLWPDEPNADPGLRADLSLLLDHKVLLPAIRDNVTSLHDVWQDLTKREVPEAGSERYVHFVEEHLGNKGRVTYQASAVSGFFEIKFLPRLHEATAVSASKTRFARRYTITYPNRTSCTTSTCGSGWTRS
jgi:hypothetical protein